MRKKRAIARLAHIYVARHKNHAAVLISANVAKAMAAGHWSKARDWISVRQMAWWEQDLV